MKNTLKKPTMFNIVLGNIILMIKEQINDNTMPSPKKIGSYTLLQRMVRPHKSSNSAIGIYQKGRKKYFIKSWTGIIKDINYYCIVSQYLTNKAFHELFVSKSNKYNIKTPKAIEYIKSKNSLSVVYEYIDGRQLDKFDSEIQAKIIVNIANNLKSFSDSLSEEEKKYFSKRNKLFYMFILLVASIILLIFSPRNFKIILNSFFNSIAALLSSKENGQSLAHRDLLPKNIMVSNKNIFILDLETMVMTLPDYDYSFLQIEPDNKKIAEIVKKKFRKYGDKAITRMIALRYAVSLTNPFGLKKHYMQTLYMLNK